MANQSYEYNIDFWSRTNSNTFICNSKFHASHKAIITQLTTTTVTFYDIQIWKQGTMSTNMRDYIFNFFLILDITIIVDLMHVHILNEHLSS